MKKATFSALLVLSTLSTAPLANAACKSPYLGSTPSIPQGDVATFNEMQYSREQVEKYITTVEKRLEGCSSINAIRHNFFVYRLQNIANQYNQELARFESKPTN